MQKGSRDLLLEKGAKGVVDWMASQEKLLITDTTMRDGHQSLLATRMRSFDMVQVADAYAHNLAEFVFRGMLGGVLPLMSPIGFCKNARGRRLRDLRRRMPESY